MIMNIILAVSVLPVLPVMYFIIRNNAKPKKNIILGVTLPFEAHDDPAVKDIRRGFLKALNIFMLPLLPLAIPLFFIKSMGAAMTGFMTFLLIAMAAPYIVFAVYRSKLMALKRERNWNSKAAGMRLTDIKAAAIPTKKPSELWFLLPTILGFFPPAHALISSKDWTDTLLYLTFALMIPLFWLAYHFIYRTRSEIVNENLDLTMALNRVRRYNWSKFYIITSWLTAAANLLLWLFDVGSTAFLIIILVYTVALLIVSMQTEFAARKAQQKLTSDDIGQLYLDEDEYWIMGMFYHNPNDRHFLVNDRVGMNMSVNLARPAAKVLMALSVLCILAMPFLGLWLWSEEATPPRLVLSETTLSACHTSEEYAINLKDITSAELRETLPSMKRTWGTGLENLLKGNFSVNGYGPSKLCLNPNNPPFLVVEAGGETYFLNDGDGEVTRSVYSLIN